MSTAARTEVDVSGHLHSFLNEASESCSKASLAGTLLEFEKDWLDPDKGRIAGLEAETWFQGLKPRMKQAVSGVVRRYIQNEVSCTRELLKILSCSA